ncbi:ribosomal protein L6 [Peniophora sp. CONT]|nr:ribosomal protein L6 [Peniophora sp. CONT]
MASTSLLARAAPRASALRSSTPRNAFSTSARALKDNIGKLPIALPPNVSVTALPTLLMVTGPLGTASVPLEPYVQITQPSATELLVGVQDRDIKRQRAMWGTTRSLIANAVTGTSTGFSVPLFLVGVGYRAALEDDPRKEGGQRLRMMLGYSHVVYVPIPEGIKAEVPHATKIALSSTDKHLLGLFAAEVRAWRKPEPYKGKGIFIGNETIRIKAVKKK